VGFFPQKFSLKEKQMPVGPLPSVSSNPKTLSLTGAFLGDGGGQICRTLPSIVIAEEEQAAVHPTRRHPCAWLRKKRVAAT